MCLIVVINLREIGSGEGFWLKVTLLNLCEEENV